MSARKVNPATAAKPQPLDVVDPQSVPITFADAIVTIGPHNPGATGYLNISLGAVDHTFVQRPGDRPQIIVTSRLRVSLPFAIHLHDALGKILLAVNSPAGQAH